MTGRACPTGPEQVPLALRATRRQIAVAVELLDARGPGATARARGAANVARNALEDCLDIALLQAGLRTVPRATRTRLTVLRTVWPADRHRLAAAAWALLSEACHQHPQSLPPSPAEVRALVGQVADLVDHLTRQPPLRGFPHARADPHRRPRRPDHGGGHGRLPVA